jgi:hypothetical protein
MCISGGYILVLSVERKDFKYIDVMGFNSPLYFIGNVLPTLIGTKNMETL